MSLAYEISFVVAASVVSFAVLFKILTNLRGTLSGVVVDLDAVEKVIKLGKELDRYGEANDNLRIEQNRLASENQFLRAEAKILKEDLRNARNLNAASSRSLDLLRTFIDDLITELQHGDFRCKLEEYAGRLETMLVDEQEKDA